MQGRAICEGLKNRLRQPQSLEGGYPWKGRMQAVQETYFLFREIV